MLIHICRLCFVGAPILRSGYYAADAANERTPADAGDLPRLLMCAADFGIHCLPYQLINEPPFVRLSLQELR